MESHRHVTSNPCMTHFLSPQRFLRDQLKVTNILDIVFPRVLSSWKMYGVYLINFLFTNSAIGSVLSKYHLGKLPGTLKYMTILNPFIRSASSMASRLIQIKWYLALGIGKCSQLCNHTLHAALCQCLSWQGVW